MHRKPYKLIFAMAVFLSPTAALAEPSINFDQGNLDVREILEQSKELLIPLPKLSEERHGILAERDKEITIQNFEVNEKLVPGQVIIFHNIYFDGDSATIRYESYPVLDEALRILQDNPNVIVEIAGHTASVGSASYNMQLSLARAYSVKTYFIARGIPSNRLFARGYGRRVPIATNLTSAGRQMNRRIEFKILSTKKD